MKKFIIAVVIVLLFFVAAVVQADQWDDLEKQKQEIQKTINDISSANTTNESTLNDLNRQLESIKSKISYLEREIEKKQVQVDEGEKDLAQQKILLNERAKSYYKNAGKNSISFIQLFLSDNLSESLQNFFYQKTLVDADKREILKIAVYIKDIEDKKKTLEEEGQRLAVIKAEVDKQSSFLAGEVAKTKKYLGELENKIAELSAKQQEIINARSGGFTVNIGDSELADDYNASIKGFRESAPGGSFAVFAFGAHTHRKGMSQYGARGRAEQGQNVNQILQAYYGKEPVGKDTGGDIQVDGYGGMNFEDRYLMGIAEMPSSWHPEALKAQAIAARTYAYRLKIEGRSICTTEKCQVYNDGKASNPPEAWKNAVQSTRGQVLEDVVTYYASTHGGFASPIGWDTTDGGGGGNFIDKSYDKIGGSPWLYKAWYTQGYSTSSDKCGLNNPWLTPEEMADIVNAAIALKTDGIDTGRITPVTTSCWGGNPYSMDELRNLVAGKGGISSATSVSVSQGAGLTNNVVINGVTFSGEEFKKAFNLRAPGRLSIPQSGFWFYNIEKK